jgi:SAM-dependent methyltransferase
MATDPFSAFKAAQREAWGLFSPLAAYTTPPAALLVEYAGVCAGRTVLDVGCGTGVVAVTAAQRGATACGLDLSPVLLADARKNASIIGTAMEFVEGDAESLPYPDASFDIVLSQFAHMFAPRPEIAIAEMLRVLKTGGRIAFSTWPPELAMGRLFDLVGSHLPPPPGPVPAAPVAWGDPNVVRERLGSNVKDLEFAREEMMFPALSVRHYRLTLELTAGPFAKLVQVLADQPAKLATFRAQVEAAIAPYFHQNRMRLGFLMTRAIKV